ncbi:MULTISPECIES: sigma-70 family RNA polymerase sigma factor [unclassified Streptomyces]|uniref:sigma-70 family RNA polymerase sigma factor n=1 Tax=unclassified Streptomyces TaxID=2593676 RepID=UPI003D75C53A
MSVQSRAAQPHGDAAGPGRGRARSRTPQDELVHRMAACGPGPERRALREAVVRAFLPVARRLARRYGSPADSREDLYQVACLGLVKAVDGFDPARGHDFLSYAVPTIDGELKRHLRDHTWHVHVPRRIQEKHRRVRAAQEELRRAGRADGGTTRELRQLTGLDEREIELALLADQARNPVSVDELRGPERSVSLADTIGADDPALDRVTDRVALGSLVTTLPERERRVMHLYFADGLTQRQVAERVGVSQMHISRLLSRACGTLRRHLQTD